MPKFPLIISVVWKKETELKVWGTELQGYCLVFGAHLPSVCLWVIPLSFFLTFRTWQRGRQLIASDLVSVSGLEGGKIWLMCFSISVFELSFSFFLFTLFILNLKQYLKQRKIVLPLADNNLLARSTKQ